MYPSPNLDSKCTFILGLGYLYRLASMFLDGLSSLMIPTKLPRFSIDLAAPNLYPPLPGTKALMSPHPFFMKSPFQLRFFLS